VAQRPAEFTCATCMERYCDEAAELPGSLGEAPFEKFVIEDSRTGQRIIESRTCLLPKISNQSRYWLRLHVHYQNKLLPFAGGMLDQPEKFNRAMEVIERVFSDGK